MFIPCLTPLIHPIPVRQTTDTPHSVSLQLPHLPGAAKEPRAPRVPQCRSRVRRPRHPHHQSNQHLKLTPPPPKQIPPRPPRRHQPRLRSAPYPSTSQNLQAHPQAKGNRPPWALPAKAVYGRFDARRSVERHARRAPLPFSTPQDLMVAGKTMVVRPPLPFFAFPPPSKTNLPLSPSAPCTTSNNTTPPKSSLQPSTTSFTSFGLRPTPT